MPLRRPQKESPIRQVAASQPLAPSWGALPPKDDSGYFEMLSKAIFTAGLNWKMVENKWPSFMKAFDGFDPTSVSRYSSKEVSALMKDKGIVRNEKKIWATVENARAILDMRKEFGSVRGFVGSYGGKEKLLQEEIQARFKFMGPSTARTFLWMVGYKLTPTKEEKAWL